MSDFVFFEPAPALAQKFHLPQLPWPVRRERAPEIFSVRDGVDVSAALDEMRQFLAEAPANIPAYREVFAMLSYLAGVSDASDGHMESAVAHFQAGLSVAPEALSLRANYALALQCVGRADEAAHEYERVVSMTPKDRLMPVVWIALARLHVASGQFGKALALAQAVAAVDDSAALRRFIDEMRAKIAPPPAAPVHVKRFCGACGAPIKPGWTFCGACGDRLS